MDKNDRWLKRHKFEPLPVSGESAYFQDRCYWRMGGRVAFTVVHLFKNAPEWQWECMCDSQALPNTVQVSGGSARDVVIEAIRKVGNMIGEELDEVLKRRGENEEFLWEMLDDRKKETK